MKNENKNNKPTLGEVLAERGEGSVPEPTQDEIVTQALGDLSAQQRLQLELQQSQFVGEKPTITTTEKSVMIPPQVRGPITGQKMNPMVGNPLPRNVPTTKQNRESMAEGIKQEKAETISIQPETVTMSESSESSSPEKGTIPASNISPPPAGMTSTPVLQESPQKELMESDLSKTIDNIGQSNKDPHLRRLVEFINDSGITVDWVRLHLGHVSRIPSVIPSITLWNGPSFEDVAKNVYLTIVALGYVENTWPILKMVMGSSVDNVEWAAGVLCTIALFDTIRVMAADKN